MGRQRATRLHNLTHLNIRSLDLQRCFDLERLDVLQRFRTFDPDKRPIRAVLLAGPPPTAPRDCMERDLTTIWADLQGVRLDEGFPSDGRHLCCGGAGYLCVCAEWTAEVRIRKRGQAPGNGGPVGYIAIPFFLSFFPPLSLHTVPLIKSTSNRSAYRG
jgi:hypothetical protein